MLLRPIAVIQLFPLSFFFSVFSNTDNIIILRKIGDTSTEEEKNGTQKQQKNSSFSREQSNPPKHRQQRGKFYRKIIRGKKKSEIFLSNWISKFTNLECVLKLHVASLSSCYLLLV